MQTLNDFLKTLPATTSNPRKRIQLIAKELALGVTNGFWDDNIVTDDDDVDGESVIPHNKNLKSYFRERWDIEDIRRERKLLNSYGFLTRNNYRDRLTQSAFELIDETEPFNVFVSYKRSESSALALLVLARLKEYGLVPFVDMALEAGGNWHADLEERIKACDYFILLLGEDTLSSPMTVKEIQWSLQYRRTIIPLWHSGFDLTDKKWAEIDQEVKEAIQQTNAIRVTDESASGYNSAIVELLNRFGITP
ncbi:MAG: toll/interleukin-1 receptor domain-containing protein [Chloroflexi bacterium]|nr:toll/interleukin-1 receptor domain-containing protein [Chloroflexota bacterium]